MAVGRCRDNSDKSSKAGFAICFVRDDPAAHNFRIMTHVPALIAGAAAENS